MKVPGLIGMGLEEQELVCPVLGGSGHQGSNRGSRQVVTDPEVRCLHPDRGLKGGCWDVTDW